MIDLKARFQRVELLKQKKKDQAEKRRLDVARTGDESFLQGQPLFPETAGLFETSRDDYDAPEWVGGRVMKVSLNQACSLEVDRSHRESTLSEIQAYLQQQEEHRQMIEGLEALRAKKQQVTIMPAAPGPRKARA